MSETIHAKPGPAIGEVHEVRARFADPVQCITRWSNWHCLASIAQI